MEDLRKKAKEKGLKGWSSLNKPQLKRLVEEGLRPNQVSIGVQTEPCNECNLRVFIEHMHAKAAALGIQKTVVSISEIEEAERRAIQRKIVYDGIYIDSLTGEVLGSGVVYERNR